MFLLITTLSVAQKAKIISGDFNFLSSQKSINVVFDYSSLLLMKDNLSEEEYIAQRKAYLNEKTRGNGDLWEQKWNAAKESTWEPSFIEPMLKRVSDSKGVMFKKGLEGAKYTLVVDVIWIYPGWDAGVMEQKAKVTTQLKFVETANPDKVVLEILMNKTPGLRNNLNNETRVGEAFAMTANILGKLLIRKAF